MPSRKGSPGPAQTVILCKKAKPTPYRGYDILDSHSDQGRACWFGRCRRKVRL